MTTLRKMTATISALVMLCSLGSCMAINVGATYENADKYTAGNREFSDKVSSIEIDWTSGNVNVSYQEADKVSVTETCKETLDESQQVHTWLDGETLRIKFCESGTIAKNNFAEKQLDVKIPKNVPLTFLDLDGASCDYTFDSIVSDSIEADVSSGIGIIKDCTAKKFDFDSSSGSVELTQKGSSDSIKMDTASGSITINADTAESIDCDTASGTININVAEAGKISADSASGNMNITSSSMPKSIDLDAASGDITLALPENSDFTADIDTGSGKVETGLALKKSGDSYVNGSGTNKISIDTASGDVNIISAS